MAKIYLGPIGSVGQYKNLYRDAKTGIAWIEDGSTGSCHTAHPSIHYTGSIRGMKDRRYWDKKARCVRCRGCIYNIDICIMEDEFDMIARDNCRCGGYHG